MTGYEFREHQKLDIVNVFSAAYQWLLCVLNNGCFIHAPQVWSFFVIENVFTGRFQKR